MLSSKRMRQQSRPIHCKHLSLIESTTARVTLRKSLMGKPDHLYSDCHQGASSCELSCGTNLRTRKTNGNSVPRAKFHRLEINRKTPPIVHFDLGSCARIILAGHMHKNDWLIDLIIFTPAQVGVGRSGVGCVQGAVALFARRIISPVLV